MLDLVHVKASLNAMRIEEIDAEFILLSKGFLLVEVVFNSLFLLVRGESFNNAWQKLFSFRYFGQLIVDDLSKVNVSVC